MASRTGAQAWTIAVAMGITACGGGDLLLAVDLKSDLVPGREITEALVEVSGGGWSTSSRVSIDSGETRLVNGLRVLEVDVPSPGSYTVLLTIEPTSQVHRRGPDVRGPTSVTISVSRACGTITCPRPGEPPEADQCVGGECVDCSGSRAERCGALQCTTDSDCNMAVPSCVVSSCDDSGTCFYKPDDTSCASSQLCDFMLGCTGGMPDAGPACASGLADCDGMASNGCETDLTLPESCGTCTRACAASESCVAGACIASWQPMTTTLAPIGRGYATSVWTGTELVVFGGCNADPPCGTAALANGGRYDPVLDRWRTMTAAPLGPRYLAPAVWTGTEMIVWGGGETATPTVYRDGARYDPATDMWSPLPAPPPSLLARGGHAAVWTGSEMIVWGGRDFPTQAFKDGARYNPSSGWTYVPQPSFTFVPRWNAEAVWTGTEMIVWGGLAFDGTALADGAAYNPVTGAWRHIAAAAPSARGDVVMTWTGTEAAMFGGDGGTDRNLWLLSPAALSWRSIPTTLSGRTAQHAQVWSGRELIVWGGVDAAMTPLNSGGLLDPVTGSVRPTTTSGAPAGAQASAYAWTGDSMIVWSGFDGSSYPRTGARYHPR